MNDEEPTLSIPPTSHTPQTPHIQLDLRHILKASYADALHVVRNAREVTGRPRQVQLAALLGICVAFLVGLLTIQHLDTPLTVATRAFGIALPFLVMDFIVASQDLKPDKSVFLVNVLKFAAFVACEVVGSLGVGVGVVAVLWHFSSTALVLTIIATALALLMPGIVLLVIILWLVILNARAQRAGVELQIKDLAPKSKFLSLFVPPMTKSSRAAQPPSTAEPAESPKSPESPAELPALQEANTRP